MKKRIYISGYITVNTDAILDVTRQSGLTEEFENNELYDHNIDDLEDIQVRVVNSE